MPSSIFKHGLPLLPPSSPRTQHLSQLSLVPTPRLKLAVRRTASMAITESHPRIKVEIICNGTALKVSRARYK